MSGVLTPQKSLSTGSQPVPPAVNSMAVSQQSVVVLAGNPNVGKSVVFNALTGQYANVSNFPGTTVDITKGKLNPDVTLQDSPGVYGLSRINEEEVVAEKAILAADSIINVVSALSIERDLFLTQQLIDYGKKVLVVVNQLDEAAAQQIAIDLNRLATLLNVPVLGTVAITGQGIEAVKARYTEASLGHRTPDVPDANQLMALEQHPGARITLYGLRRHHVNAIVSQVVSHTHKQPSKRSQWSKAVGQWLLNPWVGMTSLVVVLLGLYQMVGVWVAGDLVNFTEGQVMLGYVVPFIQNVVQHVHPTNSWVYMLLAGEFGVLTMSLQYIYGVLFPLVLGFYIYISLLEDCGYLPRIAVLSDSVLSRIGLNGRAIIPLILGFGCVTMATVSTRVLTSQRERTIAATLLAITIPCSAQLAVIMVLMAAIGGLKGWAVYIGLLVSIFLILGALLNKVLPGRSTALVLDLPPMRWPQPKNVLQKTWVRTKAFINEAAPLFVLGSAIVAVLQVTGLLVWLQSALAPVTQTLLHLPAETAKVFIMGLVRRDFGAAGLYSMVDILTPVQMLTALMVITLFVPCIASATIFWKERGLGEAATILLGSWVMAFGIGVVVSRLFEWLPII